MSNINKILPFSLLPVFILGAHLSSANEATEQTVKCAEHWTMQPIPIGTKYGMEVIPQSSSAQAITQSTINKIFYLEAISEAKSSSGLVRTFVSSVHLALPQDISAETNAVSGTSLQEVGLFRVTESIFTTGSYGPRHSHYKVPHNKLISKLRSDSFGVIRDMRPGEAVYIKAKLKQPSIGKGLLKQTLIENSDIKVEYLGCSRRQYAGQSFIVRSYIKESEKTMSSQNGHSQTHFNRMRLDVDEKTGMILESTKYLRTGAVDSHSRLVEIIPAMVNHE